MKSSRSLPLNGIARSPFPQGLLSGEASIPLESPIRPAWIPRSRVHLLPMVLMPLAMLGVLHAATAGSEASGPAFLPNGWDADSLGSVLGPVVSALIGKFGGILQGLTAMALLRTIFKPVMAALESALADHPTQAARLNQFERSMAFRALAFALDLATSIKLHLITPPPLSGGTNPGGSSHSA